MCGVWVWVSLREYFIICLPVHVCAVVRVFTHVRMHACVLDEGVGRCMYACVWACTQAR